MAKKKIKPPDKNSKNLARIKRLSASLVKYRTVSQQMLSRKQEEIFIKSETINKLQTENDRLWFAINSLTEANKQLGKSNYERSCTQ